MKIGLFFGSFNPIHIGHLIIANHMVEFTNLDQVWVILSPQNPFKKNFNLLKEHYRLKMVYKAIKDFPKIRALDIEFNLPRPSYTINTLIFLKKKYFNYKFYIIMGSDTLIYLNKWKNYKEILLYYPIYIYPRLGIKPMLSLLNQGNFSQIKAPIINISSSFIRKSINDNKNIKPLLPQKVWEYLKKNFFYKKNYNL